MDKTETRCLGISARTEPVNCAYKDGKLDVVHSKSRCAKERHKLDEDLNSLMKIIHEKEASLKERMNDGDVLQSRLKDIRHDKEDTISRRKIIDDDLRALNNEKTGETFIKLRGSLQYRTEKALNEAISRLELQLTTHNYRVSEEKKIVQEIDRLKRSKKSLKEYLALEEELNQMKTKQRLMRSQRDGLYRQVTLLKADEDEIKKSSLENRTQIDQLKKDLDELHAQKRKAMIDLKQAAQPMLHLRELHQKKAHNLRKKEYSNMFQHGCLRECKGSVQDYPHCRKERNGGKPSDALIEKEILCNTLMTYLYRLTASPTSMPSTPVVEQDSKVGTSPVTEIQDGDKVLVLKKRCEIDDGFIFQKSLRAPKKGKRDRKRTQQNRLLSHTPEMLDQFYKLDISPPSSLNDVRLCLEALGSKKHQLHHGRESISPRLSPESRLPCIAECVDKINVNYDDRCGVIDNESTCRHIVGSITNVDHESDCDTLSRNGAVCVQNNEKQVSAKLLPPSSNVVMEGCQNTSCGLLNFPHCPILNGKGDLHHVKKNHGESLDIIGGKCLVFNEPDSDKTVTMSNGNEKYAATERKDFSVHHSIHFDNCSTLSNDKLGLQNSDFAIVNPNHSSCYVDVPFLDPHVVSKVLKPPPDCYLVNGVCNGDVPISHSCNEIILDENLNSDQGKENSIAYSRS